MNISSPVERQRVPVRQRSPYVPPPTPDNCEVDVVNPDAIREARRGLPSDSALAAIAETLSLLASPTRLKMLLALQSSGSAPEVSCVFSIWPW